MMADSEKELEEMARAIKLRPEWKQGGRRIHYDITPAKRKQAIALGAKCVTSRELITMFPVEEQS